jgi:phosphoglycolate phosphatase-like HAD superfamily hydrolase
VTEEIVIFDIDGTLADMSERIHHVRKKPKNWNAFFQGMAHDKAIHSMVRLCNILYRRGRRSAPSLGYPAICN